jgi:hypothetical protein
MQQYEIRILRGDGSPSIIMAGAYYSDESAICAARRMARGYQFEVWRGMACVTGLAKINHALRSGAGSAAR